MQSSTSLRASTSMAVQTSINSEDSPNPRGQGYNGVLSNLPQAQASTKYANIQPAIAIKPKPAGTPKSTFNPTYNQKSTKPASFLQNDSLINTSRKWVLPPRPRPGRKPTAGGSPGPEKTAPKKKPKVKREDTSNGAPAPLEKSAEAPSTLPKRRVGSASGASATVTGVSGGSPHAMLSKSPSSTPVAVTPAMASSGSVTASSSPKCQAPNTSTTNPGMQVNELQRSYLARLKEQELIKNYIDVLTNQIKQLRFVQSGVITFDVLNDTSENNVRTKKQLSPLSFELFDHINNIHDLDKYLAYLTTQLNVIHSVTKRINNINGIGVGRADQPSGLVLRQVRNYLDRRSQSSLSPETSSLSTPEASENFTPSLLQPLRMDTLDPEDNLVVDIVSNNDALGGERGRLEETIPDLPVDLMNLLHDDVKPVPEKKPRKMGCGFCTNDTPCVCFDAENF